ncbi:hypothetical protein [Amycolatopsis echigonensis]|uniref:Secreted protein n=1 Tax=Amycolatopsis echigonensis TaxID=2576905 RepID=A0A2N3X0B2_9PSEU|nr:MULTISPECIES: hypothetical protein [Amycolatopsis]MBB2501226.1 hypothetical protein [Amycolatopsis echigonensis]PKV99554.1 hypothetical protein ATK30_0532 [Amycolatopsis niigatensis]
MPVPRTIHRTAITVATALAGGVLTAGTAAADSSPPLSNPLNRSATATADSSGGAAHAVAQCPSGYQVSSGGYAVSSYGPTVYTNRPTDDGTGWEVYASGNTAKPFQLKAYARCTLV